MKGPTDGGPVRRAPFSDNPKVGVRGQRTQQRIVEAALEVFGEVGFHRCSIDRITKLAGCSRVSFYQYFSGKDDLYRHLSGQVARQLAASTEMLGPLTPDEAGWQSIRQWVGRHCDIYQRYEPVFDVHAAARTLDEVVATGAARTSDRNVARIRTRLSRTELPPGQLDDVLSLLVQALTRTQHLAALLRGWSPGTHPLDQVSDALADVVHRTLFGLRPDVNVHSGATMPPPAADIASTLRDVAAGGADPTLTPTGERTLEALIEAGQAVLVQRGYDRTRVDDVVEAAGVSHGAFYRYFENKSQLARAVGIRAFRRVSTSFEQIPPAPVTASADDTHTEEAGAELRSWLRRYESAFTSEAGIIDVWVDASRDDLEFAVASAAAVDWGRRRIATFLRPRGFGDVETEAVVLMGIITARPLTDRRPGSVDPLALVIERGLLGLGKGIAAPSV